MIRFLPALNLSFARTRRMLPYAALFLCSVALYSENAPVTFRFDLKKDDVLIIEKNQNIAITEGGITQTKEEKNRIVLHVKETMKEGNRLQGSFYTYSRTPVGTGNFRQEQTFYSDFLISDLGYYQVPDQFIMPNLRSMPSFPDYPLKPGQSWKAEAMETMDFGNIKLRIPLNIDYKYTERKEITDRQNRLRVLDRIDFGYEYTYSLNAAEKKSLPFSVISARSKDAVFFETSEGIPLFDRKHVVYLFAYKDGSVQKAEYVIDTRYRKIRHTPEKDKAVLAARINEDLKNDKTLKAYESEEGIVLRMDDILFDLNSSVLTDRARETVKKIAEILKNHPDREIRIHGHTDSSGSDSFNQKLSEDRARAVLEELKNNHGIDPQRLSFRGFGKSQPVADNQSAEGRARNRRVEVIIVME